MSSSWHIWASPNMKLTSLVTFAKQFIKRPSGVDHKWAVPQMSLLFENLNQCMLLHKHIIQSLPSLEATHTIELLAIVVETLTFKNLNSHATTLIAKCTVLYWRSWFSQVFNSSAWHWVSREVIPYMEVSSVNNSVNPAFSLERQSRD